MRSEIRTFAVTALILTLGAVAASLAKPKTMTLPPETAALKETSEPGFELTANTCTVCVNDLAFDSIDRLTKSSNGTC